jgi:threonine synthase
MEKDEMAILDATAHSLKFIGFQQMYFEDSFPPDYEIKPKKEFINAPRLILAEDEKKNLSEKEFTLEAGNRIVEMLGLSKKE